MMHFSTLGRRKQSPNKCKYIHKTIRNYYPDYEIIKCRFEQKITKIVNSLIKVHLSDDEGGDSTDEYKNNQLFEKLNHKHSLKKHDKLNNKKENDYEIGFYMQLADDKHISAWMKGKGDRIVFFFSIMMYSYPDID